MTWSDGDLRFGLEAVEQAEADPDGGFRPAGVDDEFATALVDELLRRGWATADSVLRGGDRIVAVRGPRLTPSGRHELATWRDSDRTPPSDKPWSPVAAWSKLRRRAERFSPLEREIDAAEADLRQRGMYQSGPSIVRAIQVASDHDLAWSADDEAFVPKDRPRTHDVRRVMVVHGRDADARNALFELLDGIGLDPLEWEEIVRLTGMGNPFVGDVVERGFEEALAAVVLFTPDDEVRLHPDLHGDGEPDFEARLTCQPRPNVILEAGMALLSHPNRTIIVQVGEVRPISDLGGRSIVHLGRRGSLRALAERLVAAGCPANLDSEHLTGDGVFADLAARRRQPSSAVPDTFPGSFELNYDAVNPDNNPPGTGRLLITYDGPISCDEVSVEEIRDARWATAVGAIERHSPVTRDGITADVLRHLQPGATLPFVVHVHPEGMTGEISLRFTPTIAGRAYAPVIARCRAQAPPK